MEKKSYHLITVSFIIREFDDKSNSKNQSFLFINKNKTYAKINYIPIQ